MVTKCMKVQKIDDGAAQQPIDDVDLVGNFGPAQDYDKGPRASCSPLIWAALKANATVTARMQTGPWPTCVKQSLHQVTNTY